MLPEQQQRIMGYFIEEAKDHLNTIEQGLLNLQSTIEDADKANEVFRAAHSVKGGAAMLGIESIQKTAHRMEDYFKVLKEAPVQVDRTLETMFLRVSDGLKDLLEQLEGPFGLTPEKAQEIMADVEPVFTQLESHLNSLVEATGRSSMLAASVGGGSSEDLKVSFKRDVASLLRQMLTTFKQADTPDARKKIQEMCAQLIAVGEQFDLPEWCDLIETARIASANLDNDFRALAPVLIKEIKKAQDLVLSGRSSEVSVCDDLQALLPEDILEPNSDALNLDGLNGDLNDDLSSALGGELDDFPLDESDLDLTSGLASNASEDSLEDLFASEADDVASELSQEPANDADKNESGFEVSAEAALNLEDGLEGLFEFGDDGATDSFGSSDELHDDGSSDEIGRLDVDLDFDEIPSELSTLNRNVDSSEKADESMDALLATVNVTGPDVGTEELNSLADLFDGDLDELDNTLGGHAFATEEMQLHPEKIELNVEDDLTDLLSNDSPEVTSVEDGFGEDIEDDLFGGTLSEGAFATPGDALGFDQLDDVLTTDDDIGLATTADSDEIFSAGDDLFGEVVLHPSVEPLESNVAAEMTVLSEDVWATEGSAAQSPAGSEDEFIDGESLSKDVTASSPVGFADDVSFDASLSSLDLGHDVSEALEFEASSNLDPSLEALEELGGIELDGGALLEGVAEEENLDFDENSDAIVDAASEISDLDSLPRVAHTDAASPERDRPRELDIEFPTLTGEKLQEAEEDIDSFFLDTYTDGTGKRSSESAVDVSPETDLAEDLFEDQINRPVADDAGKALDINGEPDDSQLDEGQLDDSQSNDSQSDEGQLFEGQSDEGHLFEVQGSLSPEQGSPNLDNPDLESSFSDVDLEAAFLSPDASLSMDAEIKQAGSELDELLESSGMHKQDGISLSVSNSEALVDDIWEEMTASTPAVSTKDTTSLVKEIDDNEILDSTEGELLEETQSEQAVDENKSVLDVSPLDMETVSKPDMDALEDVDALEAAVSSEDTAVIEEIPEDVLAEFETAFGTDVAEGAIADNANTSEVEADLISTNDDELLNDIDPDSGVVKETSDSDIFSDLSDGDDLFSTDAIDAEQPLTATTESSLELSDFEEGSTVTVDDEVDVTASSGEATDLFSFDQDSEVPDAENLAAAFDDDFDDLDLLLSEDEDTLDSGVGDEPTFV
ncbi:MAG: Hpt domain-containing protein, partial [Cyanobacteria bacterium J06649_5]